MIDKSKIYEIFAGIRRASAMNATLVVKFKSGILEEIQLDPEKCDKIEMDFIQTQRFIGSTVCEISEIFTIGTASCEFKNPTASEIRSAVIQHFERQNSIVFQVRDADGHSSLYCYHRKDIGEPSAIKANHKTIYFATGRCFYTQNIAGIIPVKEVLLN